MKYYSWIVSLFRRNGKRINMFYVGFIYLYLNESYMPLRRNGPIIFEYTILLRRNIALISFYHGLKPVATIMSLLTELFVPWYHVNGMTLILKTHSVTKIAKVN